MLRSLTQPCTSAGGVAFRALWPRLGVDMHTGLAHTTGMCSAIVGHTQPGPIPEPRAPSTAWSSPEAASESSRQAVKTAGWLGCFLACPLTLSMPLGFHVHT